MFRKKYHQANDEIRTNTELMKKLLIKAENPQLVKRIRKKRKHTLIAAAASFCLVCTSAAAVPALIRYQSTDGNGILFESTENSSTPVPSVTSIPKKMQTPHPQKTPGATKTHLQTKAPSQTKVPSQTQRPQAAKKTAEPSNNKKTSDTYIQTTPKTSTEHKEYEYIQPYDEVEYIHNSEPENREDTPISSHPENPPSSADIHTPADDNPSAPDKKADKEPEIISNDADLDKEKRINNLIEQVVLGINSSENTDFIPYTELLPNENPDTETSAEEWTKERYMEYMNIAFMDNLILPKYMIDTSGKSMIFTTDVNTGEPLNAHWSFAYTGEDKTVLIITGNDNTAVQSYLNSDLIKSDILGTPAVVFENGDGYICYLNHGIVSFAVRSKGLSKEEFSALLISIVKEGADNL